MRRTLRVGIGLVLGAMVVAGCGGEDDASAGSDPGRRPDRLREFAG